jgi:hypothetical protein
MKDFENRWQACVARARQAPPADAEAPFGFAARVVSLARRDQRKEPDPIGVWQGMAVRLLAGAAGLLLIFAALELPHLGQRRALEPGIEHAVAKVVWSL